MAMRNSDPLVPQGRAGGNSVGSATGPSRRGSGAAFDPTQYARERREKIQKAESLRAQQRARLVALGQLPLSTDVKDENGAAPPGDRLEDLLHPVAQVSEGPSGTGKGRTSGSPARLQRSGPGADVRPKSSQRERGQAQNRERSGQSAPHHDRPIAPWAEDMDGNATILPPNHVARRAASNPHGRSAAAPAGGERRIGFLPMTPPDSPRHDHLQEHDANATQLFGVHVTQTGANQRRAQAYWPEEDSDEAPLPGISTTLQVPKDGGGSGAGVGNAALPSTDCCSSDSGGYSESSAPDAYAQPVQRQGQGQHPPVAAVVPPSADPARFDPHPCQLTQTQQHQLDELARLASALLCSQRVGPAEQRLQELLPPFSSSSSSQQQQAKEQQQQQQQQAQHSNNHRQGPPVPRRAWSPELDSSESEPPHRSRPAAKGSRVTEPQPLKVPHERSWDLEEDEGEDSLDEAARPHAVPVARSAALIGTADNRRPDPALHRRLSPPSPEPHPRPSSSSSSSSQRANQHQYHQHHRPSRPAMEAGRRSPELEQIWERDEDGAAPAPPHHPPSSGHHSHQHAQSHHSKSAKLPSTSNSNSNSSHMAKMGSSKHPTAPRPERAVRRPSADIGSPAGHSRRMESDLMYENSPAESRENADKLLTMAGCTGIWETQVSESNFHVDVAEMTRRSRSASPENPAAGEGGPWWAEGPEPSWMRNLRNEHAARHAAVAAQTDEEDMDWQRSPVPHEHPEPPARAPRAAPRAQPGEMLPYQQQEQEQERDQEQEEEQDGSQRPRLNVQGNTDDGSDEPSPFPTPEPQPEVNVSGSTTTPLSSHPKRAPLPAHTSPLLRNPGAAKEVPPLPGPGNGASAAQSAKPSQGNVSRVASSRKNPSFSRSAAEEDNEDLGYDVDEDIVEADREDAACNDASSSSDDEDRQAAITKSWASGLRLGSDEENDEDSDIDRTIWKKPSPPSQSIAFKKPAAAAKSTAASGRVAGGGVSFSSALSQPLQRSSQNRPPVPSISMSGHRGGQSQSHAAPPGPPAASARGAATARNSPMRRREDGGSVAAPAGGSRASATGNRGSKPTPKAEAKAAAEKRNSTSSSTPSSIAPGSGTNPPSASGGSPEVKPRRQSPVPAAPAAATGGGDEAGGRQMFDKNTLRTVNRDMFMSALVTYHARRLKAGASKGEMQQRKPANEDGSGLRVYLRKRPLFDKEIQQRGDYDIATILQPGGAIIHNCLFQADLKTPFIQHCKFDFDHVFDEQAESGEVYQAAGRRLVAGALDGNVSTMFMFGQTGSGKTHTMSAIQDLASQDLFADAAGQEENWISIEVVELRGNRCFDLLANTADNSRPELRLRERGDGAFGVEGAAELRPRSPEELADLMQLAQSRRATSATDANSVSSRSHSVCRIRLLRKQGGQLMLVDCAGTERKKDSMYHSKERQQEGAEINASLHALKECIRHLTKDQKVPPHAYRASSLTKILADAFIRANTARLAVVCTASPCATDTEHTISTLRMGCALGGRGEGSEEKQLLSDLMPKKEWLTHPKQWTADQVKEWLATAGGGQFSDVVDNFPSNFDGRMLVRLPENRCVQMCGGNDRKGRALFAQLHDEITRVQSSRKQG